MSRRRRGDPVDGVLPLDKPPGLSSNTALQHARRLLGAQRGGHTGTLDPMATGLLPLAFGEATKFSADLLDADKGYLATVQLGVTTTTGDAEGEVTAREPVAVDRAALDAAVARLTGPIVQLPPMHSALKKDGRPLYDYARAGEVVERTPREVTIHRLDVLAFDPAAGTVQLDVLCSKGTYVRVLAEDLGRLLGCGAHLTALRRTRVGPLGLDGAVTVEALEALSPAARRGALRPADALIATLPRVDLDAPQAARLLHGQRVVITAAPRQARIRAYAPDGRLLGTGTVDADGVLAPQRLISAPDPALDPHPDPGPDSARKTP